jgi:hypothetical protein
MSEEYDDFSPLEAVADTLAADALAALNISELSKIRSETVLLEGQDQPAGILSLDLGKSVFVWVGMGSLDLGELLVSAPQMTSAPPSASASVTANGSSAPAQGIQSSASSLLGSGVGDSDEADSFARELSRRTGKLVYLSWGVGESVPSEYHLVIQQTVLKHLAAGKSS